jgi:hypothetical protein
VGAAVCYFVGLALLKGFLVGGGKNYSLPFLYVKSARAV